MRMGTRTVRVMPSGVGRGVGVTVGVGEAVAVGEAVGDGVMVGEDVGDGVVVTVGGGDGVAVGIGVGDGLAVTVGVGVSVAVAVGGGVREGVAEAVDWGVWIAVLGCTARGFSPVALGADPTGSTLWQAARARSSASPNRGRIVPTFGR